jgi:hypothetical protein
MDFLLGLGVGVAVGAIAADEMRALWRRLWSVVRRGKEL